MLIQDVDDRQQVEAVLAKNNKTWDYMMHTKPDAIHQRVQHFCPPPEILVPQLETLITSWEDVECSLDPSCGPLFSVSARKQAKSLI